MMGQNYPDDLQRYLNLKEKIVAQAKNRLHTFFFHSHEQRRCELFKLFLNPLKVFARLTTFGQLV